MARTYSNLVFHIVFSTSAREAHLEGAWVEELYRYIGGIIRRDGGVLEEIGGVADHVHLLVRLRPKSAVASVVRDIKSRSSAWVESNGHARPFAWQEGYAAFTVSESAVPQVIRYIQNQEEHHRTTSAREELRALLDRHGIPYDDRYT